MKIARSLAAIAVASLLLLAGCSADYYYDKGQEALAAREYDEAIENFNKAAEKEPEEPQYAQAADNARTQAADHYAAQAESQLQSRDLIAAENSARRAQSYRSDNPRAASVLDQCRTLTAQAEAKRTQALQLAGQQNYDAAMSAMRDALANHRTLPGGQADLDRIANQAADHHVAIANSKLATNDLASAEAEARRALTYQPNHAAAQQVLDQVTNYREADRLVAQARAQISAGRHEQALADLQQAAALAPQRNDIPALIASTRQALADKHLAAGQQAESQGRYADALASYNKSKDLMPGYGNVDARIAGVAQRVADEFKARADAAFAAQRWGASLVLAHVANLHRSGTVPQWQLNDRADRLRSRASMVVGIAGGSRNGASAYRTAGDRIGDAAVAHMQQFPAGGLVTLSENTLSQRLAAHGLLPANLIGPTFDHAARQVDDVSLVAAVEVTLLDIANSQSQTTGTSEYQDGQNQSINPDWTALKAKRDDAAAQVTSLENELDNLQAQRAALLAQPPSAARNSAIAQIDTKIAAKKSEHNAAQQTLAQRNANLSRTQKYVNTPVMKQHTYPIYTHTRTGRLTAVLRYALPAHGVGSPHTISIERTWTDKRVDANPARNVPGDPLQLPGEQAVRDALADQAALQVNRYIEAIAAETSMAPLQKGREAEQAGQTDEAVERYADALIVAAVPSDSVTQAWASLQRLCGSGDLTEAQSTQLADALDDTFKVLDAVPGTLDLTTDSRDDGLWATRLGGLTPSGLQLPARIRSVDGRNVQTTYGLWYAVADTPVGRTVPVVLEQDGTTYTANVRKKELQP